MPTFRFYFLLIWCFLLSFASIGQHVFKGKIFDKENNLPIVNASIIATKYISKDTLLEAFTYSDSTGNFMISIDSLDHHSFALTIRHISFESSNFLLNKSTQYLSIGLIPKRIELHEVFVYEKKRMEIQGDTTTFYPDAFRLGQEKKLKDLLKNLPGMEVNETTGALKFKGKAVQQVQINGDDLMGSNYHLLTRNLSLDLVKSIEAIENFNENPLLKDMGKTEKVALNVQLKEQSKSLISEGESAFGYGQKIRQSQSIQLLGIANRLKFFSSFNANNTGLSQSTIDLGREEKMENYANEASLYQPNYLSNFFQKPLPEINQSAENSEKSIGLGSLSRPFKNVQLKWQLNFVADKLYAKETAEVQSAIDSAGIYFKDQSESRSTPSISYSNLQLTHEISLKSRLQIDLNTQFLDGKSTKLFNRNLKDTEVNTYQNHLFSNAIQIAFTRKLPKGSYQILTNFWVDQKTQLLGMKLPNLLDSSSTKWLITKQRLTYQNWKNETKIKYNLPMEEFKFIFSLTQSNEQYQFQSNIEQDRTINENYSNQYRLFATKWMQENQISFEKNNLKASILLGIHWSDYQLKESQSLTKNNIFFQKEMIISYRLSSHSSIVSAYSNKIDLPSDLPYFSKSLFVDNRNSKRNLVNLDFVTSENLFLIYRFDQLLNGITHSLQFNVNRTNNGVYNKINFSNQFFETIGFQKNLNSQQTSVMYQFSKSFLQPKLQIQIHTNYQQGNTFANLNGRSFEEVKSISKGLSGKISGKIWETTSFNYEINANWFTHVNTVNKGKNFVLKHHFQFQKTFPELIQSNMSIETILPGGASSQRFTFINIRTNYLKNIFKNCQVGFEVKNVLNNKQIQIIENSVYGRSFQEQNLIPRIWLLNFQYKI